MAQAETFSCIFKASGAPDSVPLFFFFLLFFFFFFFFFEIVVSSHVEVVRKKRYRPRAAQRFSQSNNCEIVQRVCSVSRCVFLCVCKIKIKRKREIKKKEKKSTSTFSVGATYAGRERIWEEHEGRLKESYLGRTSGKAALSRLYSWNVTSTSATECKM